LERADDWCKVDFDFGVFWCLFLSHAVNQRDFVENHLVKQGICDKVMSLLELWCKNGNMDMKEFYSKYKGEAFHFGFIGMPFINLNIHPLVYLMYQLARRNSTAQFFKEKKALEMLQGIKPPLILYQLEYAMKNRFITTE
jgi:hypothetical protein